MFVRRAAIQRWARPLAVAVGMLASSAVAVTCGDANSGSPPTGPGGTDPDAAEPPFEGGGAGLGDAIFTTPDAGACQSDQAFLQRGLVKGAFFANNQRWPRLTANEKLIVFMNDRFGPNRFYVGVRERTDEPFVSGESLDLDANGQAPAEVAISGDGLLAVFSRPVAPSGFDLFSARRATIDDPFGAPVALGLGGIKAARQPALSLDGRELFFVSSGTGASKLHAARLEGATFVDKGPVFPASPDAEQAPAPSADRRQLFFGSDRPGGVGGVDIWVASRETPDGPYGAPTLVIELSGPLDDFPGWASADGCRLYYHAVVAGTMAAVYYAERAR